MKKKIIMFDIDNTIVRTKGSDYLKSKARKQIINFVNKLYDKGYYIKIFTSRYMGRNNENADLVKKKYYNKTFNQLASWKLKFHELIMGKPSYDIYIDDKSMNIKHKSTIVYLKKLTK